MTPLLLLRGKTELPSHQDTSRAPDTQGAGGFLSLSPDLATGRVPGSACLTVENTLRFYQAAHLNRAEMRMIREVKQQSKALERDVSPNPLLRESKELK